MLIVQEIESKKLTAYKFVREMCKSNRWSYSYLKGVKLNNQPRKYKGHYLFRVKP